MHCLANLPNVSDSAAWITALQDWIAACGPALDISGNVLYLESVFATLIA